MKREDPEDPSPEQEDAPDRARLYGARHGNADGDSKGGQKEQPSIGIERDHVGRPMNIMVSR